MKQYLLYFYNSGYVIAEVIEQDLNYVYAKIIKNATGASTFTIGCSWCFDKPSVILANSINELEKIIVFQ